jgi:serine/threonine protein phosphatase PrpC
MSEYEITAEFEAQELTAENVPLRVVPKLSFGAKTDIGRLRENNEDKYEFRIPDDDQLLATRGSTFIVCDGMGGAEAGQIASELATKTYLDVYYNHHSSSPLDAARDAAKAANRFVNDVSRTVPGRNGMGCTLTALSFIQDSAVLAHVGDSRAYVIADNDIRQLSEEHTYIEEQLRMGLMSYSEAKDSPYKHVLSRAVGAEKDVTPQVEVLTVRAGETYVLCSDGVSNELSDGDMLDLSLSNGPSEAAWKIINDALLAGGRDNATVIVIRIDALNEVASDPSQGA